MIAAPSHYDPQDPLLTPHVAAKRLGVHRETIYRWMHRGLLPFIALGPRRKMIRESEVRRILSGQRSAVA
jgi:excisionase family DNA binding protein